MFCCNSLVKTVDAEGGFGTETHFINTSRRVFYVRVHVETKEHEPKRRIDELAPRNVLKKVKWASLCFTGVCIISVLRQLANWSETREGLKKAAQNKTATHVAG